MPQTFHFPNICPTISGHAVSELAARFGTPLYVYDAETIARRLADLKAFDCVRYAEKACSNLAVIDLVRRGGAMIDTVSEFEIRRALAAGYRPEGSPPPIVYTADIFDAGALELVVEHGIHVNCGSADMISQYGSRVGGGEITLRINPGFGHGHSRKTNTGGPQSKHGIWHEQLPECLAMAASHGLAVSGLHVHIGSAADMEHLGQVCQAMERLAAQVGPSLRSISAGGGIPTPYGDGEPYVDLDGYYALWDATRRQLQEQFSHAVRLEIEPGRYLVAESGYLIAQIRAVKRQGENLFYLVDAGFNNLARPVLYGAYHPMAIARGDTSEREPACGHKDRSDESPAALLEVIVGGPLCESGDIFTQEEGGYVRRVRLPSAAVGDYLVIGCTGAYGSVMASNYNSKPMAAEVLIERGEAKLIRSRQTFEDLVKNESIPR